MANNKIMAKLKNCNRAVVISFGTIFALLFAYWLNDYAEMWAIRRSYDRYVDERLHLFSRDFSTTMEKRIQKVTDGVYVALGYGLANTVFLEAPEGVIVVDTQESMSAAEAVMQDYREISDSPVKAILYTHFHSDHISGTKAFLTNADWPVEIWSHPDHKKLNDQFRNRLGSYAFRGGMRQFGSKLRHQLGCGLGKSLMCDEGSVGGYLPPDHFVTEPHLHVSIAGLDLELIHIPGETEDHVAVWHPATGALISGDNVYKSFPNLYAIRGSSFRNPLDWVKSIATMRGLRPRFLIPCHLEPVEGDEIIQSLLSDYKDAIQYVHDQTLRHINIGTHPDAAAALIRLPERLTRNPYLTEFYGTIAWSVKGIYNGYIGWFHGHVEELNPLPPLERAHRLVKLAGGVGPMMREASEALDRDDPQWALELTSTILTVDSENVDVKWVYLRSLVDLAVKQVSAIGRNYYLTRADEVLNRLDIRIGLSTRLSLMEGITISEFAQLLPHRFNGEFCSTVNMALIYNIIDSNDSMKLLMRGGLLEHVDTVPESTPTVTIHIENSAFKELAMTKSKPWVIMKAILQGKCWINGNPLLAIKFSRCFELSDIQ